MKRFIVIILIILILALFMSCNSEQKKESETSSGNGIILREDSKKKDNTSAAEEKFITSVTGIVHMRSFDNLEFEEKSEAEKNKDKKDKTEEKDTVPLEGVSIIFKGIDSNNEYHTESTKDGIYQISDIHAGHYSISIDHPDCLRFESKVTINNDDDNKKNYKLISKIQDNTPYEKARPRFEHFTLKFGDGLKGKQVILKQIETDIIISSTDLSTDDPSSSLYNAARYHVEGILKSAVERKGLTKDQVSENSGDLAWAKKFSQNQFPEVPRTAICYIPVTNPPRSDEGKLVYDFKTLSEIELDYLDKLMQVFIENKIYFPYFSVCGEFNASTMQEGEYRVDDIVRFYDAYVRTVKKYYPNSQVGISMNNIYEYGDYHAPPYAMKKIWKEKIASGEIVTSLDFVNRLSGIGCPFDFVSTELHPGETDHYSFEFIKWYCDELLSTGKKLYLWEFWLVGKEIYDYPEDWFQQPYMNIIPEGGIEEINEDNQAVILSKFLDYIALNPEMIGFHSDAQIRDGYKLMSRAVDVPVNFGYWREDHSIKPAFYTHLNWLKSVRYVKTINNSQDVFSFEALPGAYELIYYDNNGNIENIIFELNKDRQNTELP